MSLFNVAESLESVPAPAIAPPVDSVTLSLVVSALAAVRKMPGWPEAGAADTSTSIPTHGERRTGWK